MAHIVLHYFPSQGRAEVTRQILKSKGVEFEDKIIPSAEWPAHKASGFYEFGQIPLLEIDGHKLVTGQAIERYVARKYGLYPEDPYQAYLVESIIDFKNDQTTKYALFKWVLKDPEAEQNWARTTLLDNLKLAEARLVSNHGGDGFFVGETATWADYAWFQFLHAAFYQSEERKAILEAAAPKLKAFADRFLANDERLQAWLAERPAWEY